MSRDDDLPVRLEERLDALAKQLGRVEEGLLNRVADSERSVKATINGRLGMIETRLGTTETRIADLERNQPLTVLARTIVFMFCGLILTTIAAAIIAVAIGIPARGVPTLPQPYTVPPSWKGSER